MTITQQIAAMRISTNEACKAFDKACQNQLTQINHLINICHGPTK